MSGLGLPVEGEVMRAIDPQVCAIVSSGYANDPLMANFSAYGFRGVLSKPYTMEGLNEALQQALEDSVTDDGQ